MAVGLIASLANNQGNTVRVEAIDPIDVTIGNAVAEYYSSWGCYYVCLVDATEDLVFRFQVDHNAEVEQNHALTPNKVYALTDMAADNSYATIKGDRFEYDTASFELHSDANGYIGYEATVKLDSGVYYYLHEAEPKTGEMVIDSYGNQYGAIVLGDTETGSSFYFAINNIEDGVTYDLSEFITLKLCYIGPRYWNYREATFKRTTDANELIHVEATVLTEHGDSLSLKYDEPAPVAVTGVALNKTSTTLKFGGSETLVATVSPDDADDKSLTWSSDNENVVTVDENGALTTVDVGSATIKVTTVDGNYEATCDVTVTESALSVTNKINALPDAKDVTLNDKAAIENARAAYDSLDANEKALVTTETLKKLTDDEAAYQNLADTAAANAVIEKINALPNASDVTKNDKEAIEAARAAYEALTEDQKAKISKDVLQLLVNDENALNSISSGLPTGAIVGIVIGSILGFLLIACGVLFLLNKKGIINIPFLNKERKKDESNN